MSNILTDDGHPTSGVTSLYAGGVEEEYEKCEEKDAEVGREGPILQIVAVYLELLQERQGRRARDLRDAGNARPRLWDRAVLLGVLRHFLRLVRPRAYERKGARKH